MKRASSMGVMGGMGMTDIPPEATRAFAIDAFHDLLRYRMFTELKRIPELRDTAEFIDVDVPDEKIPLAWIEARLDAFMQIERVVDDFFAVVTELRIDCERSAAIHCRRIMKLLRAEGLKPALTKKEYGIIVFQIMLDEMIETGEFPTSGP